MNSVRGKNWKLLEPRRPDESLEVALLKARNIQNPEEFFQTPTVENLPDPFLFQDMEKATERLAKAVHARERIVVYGDYDVDGLSGAALLIHTLRLLGATVSYRVPHRLNEGYGLHASYVNEMHEKGVSLMITVDCGISCATEVALAQSKGIDVIITDHHHIPEKLPPAFALLHPRVYSGYPNEQLSGSGVAFKLASALLQRAGREEFIPALTDLASLGTVADCVPLLGENRDLVKLGLRQMQITQWEGLRAILSNAGIKDNEIFNTFTIGFQIGPRLNASGRMDHAYWGLQTLLASAPEAQEKAQKLEELNAARKVAVETILEEATAQVDPTAPIILLGAANWSSGLVGLIAGRLQEKFQKPAFIMEDKGDRYVGSVRSVPGFHAVTALESVRDQLQHFGGHELAAGFSVSAENYPKFREKILSWSAQQKIETPEHALDTELHADDFNLQTLDLLDRLAPFGIGNPAPRFLLKNAQIDSSSWVGADQTHLKLTLKLGNRKQGAIAFSARDLEPHLKTGSDLIVELQKSTWRPGEVEVRVVDSF